MKHKTAIVALFYFLSFTFISLVPEGYARNHSEQQVSPEAQREGRWAIVTNATLYGFFLYGPGTARLLELESARQIVGLEMLMGGGSFFSVLKATKNYRLGAGRSHLITGGSLAGTLYGLGVPVLFESENDKAYWAAAMIGTPVGGLIAHKLSSHRWFEKGETNLILNGGWTGGMYGVAIPYLVNIEDLDDWTQAKIYVASAMVGVPAGVWATTRLIRDKPINQGRANLISLGGVVGAAYASGIATLVDVEAPRVHVFVAMLGLPVGTYLGYRLTDREEYTSGRARLITLGAYVGSLFGSGVALLTDAEGHKPYVLANILGSAAGIWYAHRFTRGGDEKPAASNNQTPISNRVAVSLPSLNEWFTMSLMMLHKPAFGEELPMELLSISF